MWELCDLPKGAQALPTKWVFNSKIRARLVVCRNFEEKNEEETFAAIVNMVMVKIFFIIIAILDWECLQFDFETAFLNAELEGKNIYIRQPPGFGDGTHQVLRLLKALYGLRESLNQWFKTVTKLMCDLRFEPLASESCIFISKDRKYA